MFVGINCSLKVELGPDIKTNQNDTRKNCYLIFSTRRALLTELGQW